MPDGLLPCCSCAHHSARCLRSKVRKGREQKTKSTQRSRVNEGFVEHFFLAPLPYLSCGLGSVYSDSLPWVRWPQLPSLLFPLKHSCHVSHSCGIILNLVDFTKVTLSVTMRRQQPNSRCRKIYGTNDPIFLQHEYHGNWKGEGNEHVSGREEEELL